MGGRVGGEGKPSIYDLRFTIYDLEIRRVSDSRNCEALAEVVGKIMGGCWFERGWIMRSQVHGLAKS